MRYNFFKKAGSNPKAPRKRKTSQHVGVNVQPAVEALERRELLTVTYHGGGVMPHVEVQGVYYGRDWYTNSALYAQTGQFENFNNNIVHSTYLDMLTNAGYGIGRGTFDQGRILTKDINKAYYLMDSQIRSDLQSQVTSGVLKTPDANRLFIVYVEPGVAIMTAGGQNSQRNFLGYHDAFTGRDQSGNYSWIHYAVIAYPGGYNPTATADGFRSNFDQMTEVASHELAEAATDPNVTLGYKGWYDDGLNEEIGDVANLRKITLNGYCVQMEVDKLDRLIVPVGATAYAGPNGFSTASATTSANNAATRSVDAAAFAPVAANGSTDRLFAPVHHETLTDHVFRKFDDLWNC